MSEEFAEIICLFRMCKERGLFRQELAFLK